MKNTFGIELKPLIIKDIMYNTVAILSHNVKYAPFGVETYFATNQVPTLTFQISALNDKIEYLKNENIVEFDGESYIIKHFSLIDDSKTIYKCECEHEVTSLKDKLNGKFEYIASSPQEMINEILKGTEWTFGGTDIPSDMLRHLNSENESALSNLVTVAEHFNARLHFNVFETNGVIHKTIGLFKNSVNRGRYIKKGRDMKTVDIKYSTDKMVTKLHVFGENDKVTGNPVSMMSVNPTGQSYVEDYSYFTNQGVPLELIKGNPRFEKELILNVNELTTPKQVYDYGIEKIKELCIPIVESTFTLKDLSMFEDYLLTPLELGEEITAINEEINFVATAMLTSITKNYDNPMETTITISNYIEHSSAIKSLVETGKVVDKVTNGNGQINGIFIQNDTIVADKIKAGAITADKIEAGAITAGKIDADAIYANNIVAGEINGDHITGNTIEGKHFKGDIIEGKHIKGDVITGKHIKGDTIEGKHIKGNTITGDHIIGKEITAEHIATGAITAGSGIIAEGAIGSLEVSEVDAGKISSGTVDTSKVTVAGTNGNLTIKGNRVQVFEGHGNERFERVSMGDVNGDGTRYGLLVRGADGKTVIMDENGVKSEGITDGSITNEKISGETKIDGYKLNINSVVAEINKDGVETIKGTKIDVDGTNLSAKLSTIATAQNDQGKKIETHQSKIEANEKAISLKVDGQTYETDKEGINSKLNKTSSSIEALEKSIKLKVEQTDIETAIDGIEVGGRNYVLNSSEEKNITSFYGLYALSPSKLNMQNKIVTVSFEAKKTSTSSALNVYAYFRSANGVVGKDSNKIGDLTTEYKRYSVNILPCSDLSTAINIAIHSGIDTPNMYIKNVKAEVGNKATDWTPSPEDIEKTISDVNSKAEDSKAKLSELSNDNKLTATEKQATKLEWDMIVGEKNKIIAQATTYGISTTDYINKYNTLSTYITPLLSNLTTTSDIVGITFRSNFTNYYNSRQDLLNSISSKAKENVDVIDKELKSPPVNVVTDESVTHMDRAIDSMLQVNKIEGNTVQNFLPSLTPSHSVHTDSTSKCVVTRKVNYLKLEIKENLASGHWSYLNWGYLRNFKCDFKPNTKYTIVGEKAIGYIRLTQGNAENPCSTQASFVNNMAVITTNDMVNPSENIVYIGTPITVGIYEWSNLMILEGDWTNKTIPPYFEGIKSVGESDVSRNTLEDIFTTLPFYPTEDEPTIIPLVENAENEEKYEFNITSCGKNLFNVLSAKDIENDSVKLINNRDGSINIIGKGTGTSEVYISTGIKAYLEKGKKYTFSAKSDATWGSGSGIDTVEGYLLHNNKYEYIENVRDNTTFTVDIDGWFYLRLDINKNDTTHKFWGIQIEESSIATEYEPYKSSTQTIHLKEPLRKLPNGICDYIDLVRKKVIRKIGEVVLDGSENWEIETSADYNRFCVKINGVMLDKKRMCVVSDRFFYIDDGKHHVNGAFAYEGKIFLYRNGTINEFKNWLKANPTTVLYELKTPVEEEDIDINQFMAQYKKGSFIIENTKVNPTVDFTYVTSVTDGLSNSSQGTAETTTKVTEISQKYADISIEVDSITSTVSNLETRQVATSKVQSFRYVRDWLNGNTVNGGNHWVELQVMVGEVNIAKGIIPTPSTSTVAENPITRYTDGDISAGSYVVTTGSGWRYLQVDLSSERTDVDMIKVWHHYSDNRAYNHKLEVSRDGTTWIELFNSEISGRYKETAKGRTYVINESYTESRLATAEQKITKDAIINTVTETIDTKVNEGINSIEIGGKNLLKASNVEKNVDSVATYDFWDISIIKNSVGKEVVFSFDAKTTGTHNALDVYFRNADGSITTPAVVVPNSKLTSTYKRYSVALKITSQVQSQTVITATVRGNSSVSGGSGNTGNYQVKNMKVEFGNKATDWTPAPEDIDKAVSDVNSKAEDSKNKLGEMANDNKFTATEKQSAKLEWDAIVGEYTKIINQAKTYSVDATNYTSKYNTLNTYITPLLTNLTITSDIVGTTFRSNFTSYYNARQDILNAISTKAKDRIDGVENDINNPPKDLVVDQRVNGINDSVNGIIRLNKIEGNTAQNFTRIGVKYSHAGNANGTISVDTTAEFAITLTAKGSKVICKDGMFKSNTIYTLIFDLKTGSGFGAPKASFYNGSSYGIGLTDISNYSTNGSYKPHRIKISTNGDICTQVVIGNHGADNPIGGMIGIKNLMVLEGDWTNVEIPPYFEDIQSVGTEVEYKESDGVDDEGNPIEVTKYRSEFDLISVGKNLCDLNNFYGYSNLTSKRIEGDSITITGDWYHYNIIKVKPNTNYMFKPTYVSGAQSGYSVYTTDFSVRLDSSVGKFNSGNLTEVALLLYSGYGTSGTTTYKDVQLEEGTTATTYEPYTSHKQTITTSEPLRKLPNGVADYIDMTRKKVIRKIGKTVFDGSESGWSSEGTNGPNCMRYIIAYPHGTERVGFCDKFLIRTSNMNHGDYEYILINGGKDIYINILRSKLATQDLAGFKAWMKANPVTVYYELVTPVEEDINVFQYMKQYEKNTFFIDNTVASPRTELTYAISVKDNIDFANKSSYESSDNLYDHISNNMQEMTKKFQTEIKQEKDRILSTVTSDFTSKEDFTTVTENISSALEQTNKDITMKFEESVSTATEIGENLNSYKKEVATYIRFDKNGIELGEQPTDSNRDVLTAKLTRDRLSFYQGGIEVAYVSNNKLYITDAEIKNSLTLGKYAYVPRANGNMSLKWLG